MNIRNAAEKDVPAVVGLFRQLDRSVRPVIEDWPVLLEFAEMNESAENLFERDLRKWLKKDTHVVLIAEAGGQPLGYLLAFVKKRPYHKVGRQMYLHHLLVVPGVRGKGVGSALVKRLEKITKGMGIGFITLRTVHHERKVVRFYLNNGFEKRLIEMIKKV